MSQELIKFLTDKAEGEALSIINIKGGAVIELVDREIRSVLENINDINTPLGTRKVILELSITPNEDRTAIKVEANPSKTKLFGAQGTTTDALLSLDSKGRAIAKEINRQPKLPGFGNVSPIKEGAN